MEHRWVFWGLVLWLMAPCLDPTHELAPQQVWTYVAPQQFNWLCFKFGEHGCLSKPPTAPPATTQLEKHVMRGPRGTGGQELSGGRSVGMNSVSKHETVWKKPSEVTPNSLLHRFDFHCVSCAMLGNSGLSNINRLFYMAFRMNQASSHSSEEAEMSQTAEPFICPRNASRQGS